ASVVAATTLLERKQSAVPLFWRWASELQYSTAGAGYLGGNRSQPSFDPGQKSLRGAGCTSRHLRPALSLPFRLANGVPSPTEARTCSGHPVSNPAAQCLVPRRSRVGNRD